MVCRCYCPTDIEQDMTGVPDTGYNPFFFPEEGATLLFRFNQASFLRILSALQNGAYQTYGNEGRQVVWDFLVNVEYPLPICEEVIDCVTNDADTKQAIAEQLIADGPMRDAVNEVSRNGAPLTTGVSAGKLVANCDYDVLFAGITSIVDTMHGNNKDFLEVMALAATQTKRLATAISAIPVISLLFADEIVEWVGKLQAEILTNYDAEWTVDVKDAYRCGLFCIAKSHDDCSLSYDDIQTFITERLGAALDPSHLLEATVQYTILGTWSGTTVVDIMMLNQINIWKVAGEWLGSVIRTLETVAALGADTPDPDWEILCVDCPTGWCVRLDPANGLNGVFTAYPVGGVDHAQWGGTGWEPNPAAHSRISIICDLGATFAITDVRIVLDVPVAVGELQNIAIYNTSATVILANGTSTDADALYGVNTTIGGFIIDVEAGTDAITGPSITSQLIAVEIHGTGTAPSIGTACE